ncbi:MAG TPA: hypothetical protein ENO31_02970 [Thermoprotei archaeon]|nr:hypothetical protein [TACK group archaeon]HEV51479.1 hypothetical protein [Thermoprotei archaeon]
MKFDFIVRQVGDNVEGIKKVTLEGKEGLVYMDDPVKLFSLDPGESVQLLINEGEEGFFSASYLPVYAKDVGNGKSYLYSAYGLLIRFDGNFTLPNETIKVTLIRGTAAKRG